MAWSSAALSASELAYRAATKPMLLAHTAYNLGNQGRWVNSTTKTFADTDVTDPLYPFKRAWDGHSAFPTAPSATSTTHAMLFYFAGGSISFDAVAFVGNSLKTLGCTSLVVQIADDNAFSTNLQTLTAAYNPSSAMSANGRIMFSDLHHTGSDARRYSGVVYARIQMTFGSAVIPPIGEVLFLRRYQLSQAGQRPWKKINRESSLVQFVSQSGAVNSYVLRKGAQIIDTAWQFDDLATSDLTTASAFWAATHQGTDPFVYVEDANGVTTSPIYEWWLANAGDSPIFSAPYVGPRETGFSLQATEIGPYFYASEG